MRLVTWNIQHGRRPEGGFDVGLLRRSCAALGADVLALQEVDVGSLRSHRADLVDEVADACGMAAVFGPARRLADRGHYGNALLVRGALEDTEVQVLPCQPGREARVAVLATAVLEGGLRLSVAVCHLGLKGEGLDQLPPLLDALAARPLPRAMLGDLNLRPGRVGPLVAAAGMRLVGGEDLTFPAHDPDRRIDHVALAGLVETAVVVPHLPVSDHRPLVVEAEQSVL